MGLRSARRSAIIAIASLALTAAPASAQFVDNEACSPGEAPGSAVGNPDFDACVLDTCEVAPMLIFNEADNEASIVDSAGCDNIPRTGSSSEGLLFTGLLAIGAGTTLVRRTRVVAFV